MKKKGDRTCTVDGGKSFPVEMPRKKGFWGTPLGRIIRPKKTSLKHACVFGGKKTTLRGTHYTLQKGEGRHGPARDKGKGRVPLKVSELP